MPNSSKPAAMPANSAQVVPMLATTSAASARTADPHAVALAHQADQALAGDDAHPRGQAVEHDQRDGGEQEHPQQLVAVVGAEHRVGGDAGRVVVGEPGEQAGTDDGQQRTDGQALPARSPHVGAFLRRRGPGRRRGPHPGPDEVSAPAARGAGEAVPPAVRRARRAWRPRSATRRRAGMARSTRSPTAGWAPRTASAATAGPTAESTSTADSVSSRLTSAASPAASRWCTAERGVASCTAWPRSEVRCRSVQATTSSPARAESRRRPRRRSTPPKPDLHADELEVLVGGAGEHHVGDPGESLPDDVDDLGVEHVAHEQELVVVDGVADRRRR